MACYDNKLLSNYCFEGGKQEDINNVFKLRNILSDKISNLTRSDKLQKGESVEITLEIELIKPESSNSANSLIEVTIIEHNKSNEQDNDMKNRNPPLYIEDKLQVETESVSQKDRRRHFFQRVISEDKGFNCLKTPIVKTYRVDDNEWKMKGDTIFNLKEEKKSFPQSINPRSNFINVLPEDIVTSSGDYRKSYKRVSTKTTPRIDQSPKPRNILTATRKKSLVKVISDLFLPSKKADKKEAVKSVLNALKNEVDNIKVEGKNNKGTKNKQKTPVHNLGKLVSNILVDMIEKSDNDSSREIKDNSFPVQYQSFFEPYKKTNKNVRRHKRKTPASKQIAESYSDICCVNPKNLSNLEVNIIDSVNNFVAINNKRTEENPNFPKNEITNNFSKKTSKISHNKPAKKRKDIRRCSTRLRSTNHINNKSSKSNLCNKIVSSKKSLIQWNGDNLEVNKDIKDKIEMLILNELQNLAIKEGMECDIKPLPPVDPVPDCSTASNVSSFLCELDVNDPIFKSEKICKRKFHSRSRTCYGPALKVNQENYLLLSEKKDKTHEEKDYCEEKDFSNDITNKQVQNLKKDYDSGKYYVHNANENNSQSFNNTILNLTDINMLDSNELKISYLNENTNNWSADSKTAIFKSPVPLRNHLKYRRKYSNNLQPYDFEKHMKNKLNSDFIKIIETDDSTWNNESNKNKIGNGSLTLRDSPHAETIVSTDTARTFIYKTSNECESTIEIELNVDDLEVILKKAKEKHNADKIVISAKCKHELEKEKCNFEFSGKNSQSYTNYLLSSAVKKLNQGKRKINKKI